MHLLATAEWSLHLAHLFARTFIRWYTFLGTSPGGIGAQIVTLILYEVRGGLWKWSTWRTNWQGGLKRAVKALLWVWAVAFCWSLITTIYDDHVQLTARLRSLQSEKKQAEDQLTAALQSLNAEKKQADECHSQLQDLTTALNGKRKPTAACPAVAGESQEQRKKREATRDTLSTLMVRGVKLGERCVIDPPALSNQLQAEGNQWFTDVVKFVK